MRQLRIGMAQINATMGNRVSEVADIEKGIEFAQGIRQLKGVVIIKDDRLGVWGEVKLVATQNE